jgi:predicted hotdog family 3-hydroxylacyl-ACP dehydratase
MSSTYPPLTSFMPHRPPMLVLDSLSAWSENAVVCSRLVREGDLFVVDGKLSSIFAIELFAQAAAAHFGYAGMQRGGAMASGALLGSRRIDLFVPHFEVGQELSVRANQVMAMPPAAQYECEVLADGVRLAAGTVNVAMGIGGGA